MSSVFCRCCPLFLELCVQSPFCYLFRFCVYIFVIVGSLFSLYLSHCLFLSRVFRNVCVCVCLQHFYIALKQVLHKVLCYPCGSSQTGVRVYLCLYIMLYVYFTDSMSKAWMCFRWKKIELWAKKTRFVHNLSIYIHASLIRNTYLHTCQQHMLTHFHSHSHKMTRNFSYTVHNFFSLLLSLFAIQMVSVSVSASVCASLALVCFRCAFM